MERVLTDRERSSRVNRSCFSPPSPEEFAAFDPAFRGRDALENAWRWLSRPGTHILSEAICTLNHELRALCRQTQSTTHSWRTSALSAEAQPIPAWKNQSSLAERLTGAQCLGLCSKGTCASDPFFIRESEEKGRDSRAGRIPGSKNAPLASRFPASFALSPLAIASPMPKSALGDSGWFPSRPTPNAPPRGSGLWALLQARSALVPVQQEGQAVRGAPGWGGLPGAPFSPSHDPASSSPLPPLPQSSPARAPQNFRPLAGLASTCPGRRARGVRVRCCLLHGPAPAVPSFLFNNITGGERSAELPPRLGLGCACKRQSPVSWLPVPSGPSQSSRSKDATLPPPSLRSWATPDPGRRRPGLDGDLRGRQFLSTSDQIPLPLTLIVVGGTVSPSSTRRAAWV